MWQCDYDIEINADPETIWEIFCDVPGWKQWNAGIEHIEINGPFEAGTVFTMTPPGQDPLTTRLIEVRKNEVFVDETRVGDIIVLVAHRIQYVAPKRTHVTYSIQVTGPSAEETGKAIAADFPDVLKALAALADSKTNAEQEKEL